MSDVKWLGSGEPVLVLGDAPDREVQNPDGSTSTVKEVQFVRLGAVETHDADGVHDERPEYDEATATWTPKGTGTGPGAEAAAEEAAPSYTKNDDGTYTREDGVHGTFGPSGFEPSGQ